MSLELVDKSYLQMFINSKMPIIFYLQYNPKDIKILQLDTPCYGESNKPKIIKFQSMVVEPL